MTPAAARLARMAEQIGRLARDCQLEGALWRCVLDRGAAYQRARVFPEVAALGAIERPHGAGEPPSVTEDGPDSTCGRGT